MAVTIDQIESARKDLLVAQIAQAEANAVCAEKVKDLSILQIQKQIEDIDARKDAKNNG